MDTSNNDAAFWIAGYTDYLRDVVALLAHRTTLHRGLFRLGCPRLDWLVRPAGDRVHPGGVRWPPKTGQAAKRESSPWSSRLAEGET